MKFKWLDFKITNRCNNHCTYCGVNQDKPRDREKVSGTALFQTVKDAIDTGFTHFAFLGGEPSLRVDFPHILEPLKNGHTVESVMVISNMLRFNEQMYRAVYDTNANHAQVVASIDNLHEPNYKHQKTLQTLEYVKRIQDIAQEYQDQCKGIREVHVHSVISRENFRELIPHIEYFNQQKIDVSMAIVEPFIVSGSEMNCNSGLQYNKFTKEEVAKIIDQLDKLEQMGLLNWANKVLREYLNLMISGISEHYYECTAGSAHVIIESDGNVYPCLTEAYRKGLKFGNIQIEPFRDIYQRMQDFHCEAPFQQTCWDHFLWTKLGKMMEGNSQ